MGPRVRSIYTGLSLEKLLRVLYSSPLAGQASHSAWLVCLSLELSRHRTGERERRLQREFQSLYQTDIKYLHKQLTVLVLEP